MATEIHPDSQEVKPRRFASFAEWLTEKRRFRYRHYHYTTGVTRGTGLMNRHGWRRVCCSKCQREIPRIVFIETTYSEHRSPRSPIDRTYVTTRRHPICWLCLPEARRRRFYARPSVGTCWTCGRPMSPRFHRGYCSEVCRRNRPRLERIECAGCGESFTPRREGQQACSPKCRKRIQRAK